MFEAKIDRQMNRALASFQRNYRPQGPNVRPMTAIEHEVFLGSNVDQYELTSRAINKADNKAGDTNPEEHKVRTREREVRPGNGPSVAFEDRMVGEYDPSRRSWQLDTRESWKVQEPGGESQSKRHLVAGKQSAGHLYGIEMQRHGDVIQMVQYDVDLNNPKNSVIAEMKPVWVRS